MESSTISRSLGVNPLSHSSIVDGWSFTSRRSLTFAIRHLLPSVFLHLCDPSFLLVDIQAGFDEVSMLLWGHGFDCSGGEGKPWPECVLDVEFHAPVFGYFVPVDPNPPSPRSLADPISPLMMATSGSFSTSSCAILSPFLTSNGSTPWLMSTTPMSP